MSSSLTNEIPIQKFSWWKVFVRQFKNPLLLIFIVATITSYALGQNTEATAIWIVMAMSIFLGFYNEYQAEKIVQDLIKRISFTVSVIRNDVTSTVPVKDVLVGDEISLRTGSIVPADMKIKISDDLQVNESALTGESLPVNKKTDDMIYMGTVITGGVAHGIVTAIGMDTKFGKISELTSRQRPLTEFQKGLKDFSSFLAKIALVTVLLIIIFGWILHHPIVETILFSLTIAMGITPELLPLIVTLSLSHGAKKLAKKSVIVKQFVSIEDLGNMEVLCTDKTGTLTEGKIFLNSAQPKVLDLALICNSSFTAHQGIAKSLSHPHKALDVIDGAITEYAQKINFNVPDNPEKIFEIPFNYENRFMTVVVKRENKFFVICKGSPEAILERCKILSARKEKILKEILDFQNSGFRVIAVASKELKDFNAKLIKSEIKDLNFAGLLDFSDVPKKDLSETLKKFEDMGVVIKIITGDSEIVAQKISRDAGFDYKKILTGPEIEKLNDDELTTLAWQTGIFARVTPSQKNRIIIALKKGNHSIGYMGDGINDGPALHVADVGISVNTAVDVAKDAASIVLLHKSLGVIADGIREGRITFNNTIKYILMGTSSDFGNMISATTASIFLPFLPMTPVQVLLTDILYDVSQLSISTDNVDEQALKMPKKWDLNYIKRFMLTFGPISTAYDFLTFYLMYFTFKARGGLFQTGWFIESLITEILVVFVIRTKRIPFWKSGPSSSLVFTCLGVVLLALILPFSPLKNYLGFVPLPSLFFVFLIAITLTYLILVEIGKSFLNKKNAT